MFTGAERIPFRRYELVILRDAKAYRNELRALEDEILTIATLSRGWDGSHVARMRAIFKISPLYLATALALVFEDGVFKGIAGCDTDFDCGPGSGINGTIVHLCSMNFSRDIQGTGLLSFLFLALLEQISGLVARHGDTVYVTSISQSPLVYSMLGKLAHVYPNARDIPPPDVIRVARAVVDKYDPDVTFEPENLILRNECDFFYNPLPQAPDRRINDFVRSKLDIAAGDVFVPVGRSSAARLNAYGARFRARFASRQQERRAVAAGGL
ncbi:hypothetical protein [Breoghania sp. L-A4]|uniref:hypothetical protein n=1 Tax=Breoghania sp. L-A4 TaxID=2304600 RepID=UPI000E35D2D0|nr:hypothetical protein [Breoghania sp. L-A4]AXS41682.1 hypothetical protein D1F64_18850 [Breoghania sp. L-A4]